MQRVAILPSAGADHIAGRRPEVEVLMMVSHIVLRKTAPDLPRPYRTPGGVVTTSIALVLAVAAVIATFFVDEIAAAVTAGIVVIAVAYYWFYSRHHLVANAPEEEFAAIAKAEAELAFFAQDDEGNAEVGTVREESQPGHGERQNNEPRLDHVAHRVHHAARA